VIRIARVLKTKNFNDLREPRIGVMLHYDGSTTDPGAMSWLEHPDCKVSYNYLVLDNGDVVVVAPKDKRAWHAGNCTSSDARLPYRDANSAFYGVAAATGSAPVTEAQLKSIVDICRYLFRENKWPEAESWRISSHRNEAWQRGRKIDPEGPRPESPILSLEQVRSAISG
jgi:N-acetyl-anhydromuramyl-L-alanine amidase AmpD